MLAIIILFIIAILAFVFPPFTQLLKEHYHGYQFINTAGAIGILILALLIEYLTLGWNRCTIKKLFNPSGSLRRDLFIFLFDMTSIWILLGKFLTIGLPFMLAGYITQLLKTHFGTDFIPQIESKILQVIVVLLTGEFIGYWLHRTFHTNKFLWHLHEYHHSATEFSVITARRDHPLVIPIFIIFTGIPAALLGFTTVDMFWIGLAISCHAMIIHSGIKADWGWFGKWVIVSPAFHRLHHSTHTAHWGKNIAFFLPIWDQVFGTYYKGDIPVVSLGTDNKFYNRNPIHKEMSWPLIKMIKMIRKKLPLTRN